MSANADVENRVVETRVDESNENAAPNNQIRPAANSTAADSDRRRGNAEASTSGKEITQELGRGKREKKKSVKLQDFVVRTVYVADDEATKAAEAEPESDGPCYQISDYLNNDRFAPHYQAFLAAYEPKLFKEAVLDKEWNNAMKIEIVALEDNETWDMVELPPGKIAIGSKWVYRIKYKADGTIERHKARLVILGNKQIEGTDFKETFAPVVKMTTERCGSP